MKNVTRSVSTLLVVGAVSAFGATKEVVATSDGSFRNEIAQGYTDDALFTADSDKLAVIHFAC